MAMIDKVIARQFDTGETPSSDSDLLIHNLDFGIYAAGKQIEVIRNAVLHGENEEAASGLLGLMAYLGQMGALVDQLPDHMRVPRRAPAPIIEEHP